MESIFIFLLFLITYIYIVYLIAKKVTIMESLNLIYIWKSQEFPALEILMSSVIGKIEVIDLVILQE